MAEVDTECKAVEVKAQDAENHITDSTTPSTPAKFSDLLEFSSPFDLFCFFTGIFTAVVSGANQPAQLIVFGSILNAFNGADSQDINSRVSLLALIHFLLGIQMWITNFLQTATISYLDS
jgi:hypothetical protein